MKEHGPSGFNPEEKLTGRGQKPYAGSEGFYMNEGGGGSADNSREDRPRNMEESPIIDPKTERPFGTPPPEPNIITDPSRRETPFTTEQKAEHLKQALISEYTRRNGSPPTSVDELRAIDLMAEMGAAPPWYNPPENAREGIGLSPQAQFEQQQQDEQRRAEQEETLVQQRMQEHRELTGREPTLEENRAYRRGVTPENLMAEKVQELLRTRADREREMRDMKVREENDPLTGDRVQTELNDEFSPDSPKAHKGGRRENFIPVDEYTGETQLIDPKNYEVDAWGGIKVDSVESLATEIMRTEKNDDFQTGGRYELLKEVEENGEIHLEFQQQNFLHWVRNWMMYWHNDSPDEEHNFTQKIRLEREHSGSITLDQMINQPTRYFRSWKRVKVKDEEGKVVTDAEGKEKEANPVYQDLVDQIKKEVWLFSSSRSADIKYNLLMGSDEKLPQTIQELYYLNTFTKTVWDNRSSLYHIMAMPEKFIDKGVAEKEESKDESDHKVGSALNMAYLLYYNISDKEKLEELLQGTGKGLLDPARIKQALWEQAARDEVPEDQLHTYLDPKDRENIDKNIMEFINIYNQMGKPGRIVSVVRKMIQEAIAEKYGLYVKDADGKIKTEKYKKYDPETGKEIGEDVRNVIDRTSVEYADTFAHSMTRWTGAAARNDVGAQGYDAWTRLQVTDKYRLKALEKKRGNAFGNPYTLHVLKQLSTDFMTGTSVEAMDVENYNWETDDEKGKYTRKMTLNVLQEMYDASEQGDKAYDDAASQLVFANNTMRGYANDHLSRAFTIFQQVNGAEELKLDKFTEFDVMRGITFDRKGFEDTLKEKFFKPMRYGYSTYAQINFAEKVRTHIDGDEYRDVHLAEAMLGREVLDGMSDPKFYKKGKRGISMESENWSEKIDWNYVNSPDGKVAIWRQVALTRIAAELYTHRDRHSNDPAYGVLYYEQIIKALESIPAGVYGDENDMQSAKGKGSFFSKDDIKWLRDKSSTESWRLFRNAAVKQSLFGIGKGFQDMLKETWKGMMR